MGDTFVSLPEFFENEIGECIQSRSESLPSFRELGPPDLCHVLKTNGRKEYGSYHLVSGIDASSSATLATYITSLSNELDANSAWIGSKSHYKIRGGVYCCYNAFSRVDLRVEVCIPGSVQTYVVNARGERSEPTPELWQETYLSAILRAILYSDDVNFSLLGYRKLDPIPNRDSEVRFLQAAENLFFKGWQLGSEPEIQVATLVHNHLSAGILKYFGEASRYEHAANLFEKLWAREPEVSALVARAYLGMNEEVKAVQVMHQALQQNPHSYVVLHVQTDLMRSKGQNAWAIKLAKQAINCAPSEFVTWAKLAECYIEAGDWAEALLTLNSCPMFTYSERDLHRIPQAARTHFPVPRLATQSRMLEDESLDQGEVDSTLLRLPAPSLRGTFASAYAILTKIVNKVGWDDLLKYRSEVFVMEEEYRKQDQLPHDGASSKDDEEQSKPMRKTPEEAHWLSFTDKRLCERWLDNLFMVLYEDLRVYTIWRAEQAHYDIQAMPIKRSATDWELLGELALRLHHPEEAHDAFLQCILQNFRPKAYQRLLEYFTEKGSLEQALSMAMHLTAYNHRWYSDSVYPSAVAKQLFKIIKIEGLSKVSNILVAMKPPPAMLRLMQWYFTYAQEFHLPGTKL
ncbi:bud site selection protein [Malassezia pachydermatis]